MPVFEGVTGILLSIPYWKKRLDGREDSHSRPFFIRKAQGLAARLRLSAR